MKQISMYLTVIILATIPALLYSQSDGDYRSASSNSWNLNATWERFNGGTMTWDPAPAPPSASDGVITILNTHNVTVNTGVSADQIVVDAGATLTVTSILTIADGTGTDLLVNGTLTLSGTIQGDGSMIVNSALTIAGTIQGNGSLTVNGNTTWNSGTLDRTFTNQNGRTLNISTVNAKTLNAPLTNDGMLDWQGGQIVSHVNVGGAFTNNSSMTISSDALYQDNGGIGTFVNAGTITKTSTGTTTFNNLNFSNSGTLNHMGTVTLGGGGSFTNTGTLTLTSGVLNNVVTFNHNTGATVDGTGTFSNSGTMNLNIDLIFSASIPFSSSGIVQGNGNLTINNDFTLAGTIQGNGSLTVNGNTTWNSGTLDRAFTNQNGRTLDISTANGKTLNAPLTNDGVLNWQGGQIVSQVNIGGAFTNNNMMTISSDALYQDNGGIGTFVNAGTITKTSTGTTTLNNLNFSNSGTLNYMGTVTHGAGGSFTNTGTLTLTSGILNNAVTFNHNTGSTVGGTGSFSNSGTMNLNIDLIFSASIPFSTSGVVQGDGNLTINNDFTLAGTIQGNGSLTVNGNTTWNSGTLDRTFTNQNGRTLNISTVNGKTLNAPLTNDGVLNWQGGQIVSQVNIGGAFTNNSAMTISSDALYQDNGGTGTFVNAGTITKTSTGTTTLNNLSFSNSGTLNYMGTVTHGGGGSFTNTGALMLTSGVLNNAVTFNHNTGSTVAGTGSFSNSGTMNLNIDLIFSASIPFSNSGVVQGDGNLTINNDFTLAGTVQGNGSLTVNGNTTWNSGTLDRTLTNQNGRTLNIATVGGKTLNAPLTNDGMLDWQGGQIVSHVNVGGAFTNNSSMTISSNALYQDNGGTGSFVNAGTITKTSSGTTTLNNLAFTNSASGHIKGLGTLLFGGGGTFTNNGFIEPGLSPGQLALNGRQPFSANSTLGIEVQSNDGPGTGHDQFSSNEAVVINGALEVDFLNSFEPAAGTSYTIFTYPSRTGTFSTEPPCWIVTYDPTSTAITYNPAFFNVCASNVMDTNSPTLCSKVIDYTIEAMGTPVPTFTYALSGATTGGGMGTGSGSAFNVGVTNVTVFANNGCSEAECSFTVTITDTEAPVPDCPDNITQGNTPGQCGASVSYSATAMDNCGVAGITYNPTSGSFFNIGATAVTATVTDVHGNTATCSFNVTVNDTELPTIDCPDNVTVSTDAATCGAVFSYAVLFDDNCAGEMLLQTSGLPSGSVFPIGVTTNTFRATDAAGNSVTCSFNVTVVDNELPSIDCPADISVSNTTGSCGAVVSYSVTGDDNCVGESITQINGLPSGSVFPVGVTVNTFRITDAAGNSTTCTFNVTVSDTEAPSINCPANVVVNDPEADGEVVNYSVTADDNCPGETIQQTTGLPSGSVFPLGMTVNTFIVTDAAGNTNSCSFTVTVTVDNTCNPPAGSMCDDGDICTINDIIGADCNCAGTFEDTDGDGTCDAEDGCPDDPDKILPGICGCGIADDDTDGDGTEDCLDGCPLDPDKTDPGICGCGVADTDSDSDGTPDCNDGCPLDPDKTDPGICGCGVADTDSDGDGTPDCNDDCPLDPDKIAPGICGCGVADTDSDGDGTPDCNDGCPLDPDKIAPGICGCGVADTDTDGDGTEDCNDDCPLDPDKVAPGICGCGIADTDTDGDGTEDCLDGCPLDPDKTVPGVCGCGVADTDTDGDGTEDCNDDCPFDPDKTVPGVCGCGVADEDTDGDGTEDCIDGCPENPNFTSPATWFADADMDGFGNAAVFEVACSQPAGFVANNTDCNDANGDIHPGATELCNGVDDDCDNFTDEGCPGGGILISVTDTTIVSETAGYVVLYVTLSSPSTQTVTVSYRTFNGTAIAGQDYRHASGVLKFLPGQTSRPFRVLIIANQIPEPDEFFRVRIFNAQGGEATIADEYGVVIITETPPMMLSTPVSGSLSLSAHTDEIAPLHAETQPEGKGFFVPNPQSKYEAFQVSGLTQPFDLVVTDIHGRVVFASNDYQNDWKMSSLNDGIYLYQIRYFNSENIAETHIGKLVVSDR